MSSPISPLFAVHAEQFYNAGSYAEALELCLRGIEIYPHYPSAYVLTARAMWALGNSAQAQEFIANATQLFPVHPALLRLEQEFFGLPPATATPSEPSLPETESEKNDLSLQDEDMILEKEDILLDSATSLSEHEVPIPQAEDSVPEEEDSVEESEDIQPEFEDVQPEFEDIQPEFEDIQPEFEDIQPEIEDIQTEIEDIQPEIEDIQPEIEDIQPEIEDIQPEIEDIQTEFEDIQTEIEDIQPIEVIVEQAVPSDSDDDDDFIPSEHSEKYTPLRIVEMTNVSHAFLPSLKASSINLIPGLDFTPLKFQNGHSHKKNGILPAPPPFPRFRERIPATSPVIPKPEEKILRSSEPIVIEHTSAPPAEESHKLTPLEELAARLEKVRIPATYEEITRTHSAELVPAMVTETMARIYEKQGAFPEAIKAYQILARRTPEKLEFYEERIREVQGRMMEEG
ncbi:MAG: hypothetical protein U0264_09415 [Candidatus Kapaibacterium sp.]